jgi:hypothetical protein
VPRIKILTLAVLAMIAISTIALAAPIPLSAVGVNKPVSLKSTDRISLSGGGRFEGSLDGFDTQFWCVDEENHVTLPTVYRANVTLLGDWGPDGTNSMVAKGDYGVVSNWNFSAAGFVSPLQRYQAAAYLLEQMSGVNGVANDLDLQSAIWSLLDLNTAIHPIDEILTSGAAFNKRTEAVDYIKSNAGFGFGAWAVVSGDLIGGSASRLDCCDMRQTFLVQVEPVPEPGTYAMMGAGLIGLAFLARRKKVR